ncbi:hypothetical protein OESDEN_07645 [Oesophagostomum dentatum]|uniref:Uncharacterized protein n=1 Tax=Oesophagostomum dentatum TaxID=61180 RepID=A0A0B1TAR4_OESDE|nr:hypothetical protein OESDEN_07645 [Oesophagostomum dentatum]
MARFGAQALTDNNENSRSRENQENMTEQEEMSKEKTDHNSANNFDEGNNELQNTDDENRYPPPVDFGVDQPVKRRRKSKKRKIRRKLHGIKSLSSMKSKEVKNLSFEKDNAAATFLGGWTEPADANGEEYVKVLPTTTPPKPFIIKACCLSFNLFPGKYFFSWTESPEELPTPSEMMANIPDIPKNFNEEDYLRQYYEQYYKEWYR